MGLEWRVLFYEVPSYVCGALRALSSKLPFSLEAEPLKVSESSWLQVEAPTRPQIIDVRRLSKTARCLKRAVANDLGIWTRKSKVEDPSGFAGSFRFFRKQSIERNTCCRLVADVMLPCSIAHFAHFPH